MFVSVSVCLCVRLSVCLFVCLFVCLSLYVCNFIILLAGNGVLGNESSGAWKFSLSQHSRFSSLDIIIM